MVDFHVHSDYSVDAQGSVSEYAEAAFEKGLREICFTTHCDLDPARRHHDGRVRLRGEIVQVTSDWLGSYVEDVEMVAKEYLPRGLKIRSGLEVGYTPGIEHLIEPVVTSFHFDFILGGVHTLEGVDIVSSKESVEYFSGHTPRQVCEVYFHDVAEAVRTSLFDCIAHMDIYKRCGADFYGEPLSGAHRGLIEPVLDLIAARGISLEINSGALRNGLPWPYPSPDILTEARKAGVTDITPGSDCHWPKDIGHGIEECLGLARDAGYGRIVVFQGRTRNEIEIGESGGEKQAD